MFFAVLPRYDFPKLFILFSSVTIYFLCASLILAAPVTSYHTPDFILKTDYKWVTVPRFTLRQWIWWDQSRTAYSLGKSILCLAWNAITRNGFGELKETTFVDVSNRVVLQKITPSLSKGLQCLLDKYDQVHYVVECSKRCIGFSRRHPIHNCSGLINLDDVCVEQCLVLHDCSTRNKICHSLSQVRSVPKRPQTCCYR